MPAGGFRNTNFAGIFLISQTYLRMCATTAGPYHSPACFPNARPRRTIPWRPNWADGLSPNQDTRVRWKTPSTWTPASSPDPAACLWDTMGSEGPGEPCREDSREATRRLAAEVVHVSVSKGCSDIAPDQVQSRRKEHILLWGFT